MKLEPLMNVTAVLKTPPQAVGAGPFGNRIIAEVSGGTFEGPRLRGSILTCGGDWLLVAPNGFGRLDVRLTLATDDGAQIYCQYTGVLEMNEKWAAARAAGKGTEFGDHYFMTQPRFETGNEGYAWLNNIVAVAQGRFTPDGIAYEMFACRSD